MRALRAAGKWRSALFALALLSASPSAQGQSSEPLQFPTLTGRVVDNANLLSEARRSALTQKLADLEQKTTAQFVVVTLTSLSGRTIEEYGYQLGRHWGIGQKNTNNGALLIVAPNERKVRIEVGYGAEGVLPDAVSSLIIQRVILPKFRANDYAGGIVAGADEVIKVLSGAGDEWKSAPKSSEDAPWWVDLIVLSIFFIPFVFVPLTIFLTIRSFTRRTLEAMKKQRGKMRSFWDALTSGSSSSSSSWGSSSSSSSWSSSSSSDSFSGGGGSFGGGGSSGSW